MQPTSQLRRQYEQIISVPPEDRHAYLAEIKREDPRLADRLIAMLACEDDALALDAMAQHSAHTISRAHQAPLPLGVPEQIGPYSITRCISSSNTTLICEARAEDAPRPVAIKILRTLTCSSNALQRFEREALALKRIRHKNIASFLDYGALPSGEPYIVMDLVEGDPLNRCEPALAAPLEEKLELLRQIAKAVQQLHFKGVIHRDIKPSNVMIRPNGTPVIIDLGIAIMEAGPEEPDLKLTQTGYAPGTPEYMSPEQISGGEVDARTDVYSLGALAYWLISGEVPIDVTGLRPSAAELRVCAEEPAPLRTIHPSASRDLSLVVSTALSKIPADRYSSASEFAMELSRVLVGDPISVTPPSIMRRVSRWSRRNKTQMRITVAAILLLLGSAVSIGIAATRAQYAQLRADRLDVSMQQHSSLLLELTTIASEQRRGPQTPYGEVLFMFADQFDFSGQTPEAQAASYRLMTGNFIMLGLEDIALPFSELSAEAHESVYGPHSPRTIQAHIQHARMLSFDGDIDTAQRIIDRARANAPDDMDKTNPDVAALLESRTGKIHLARGELAAAQKHIERSLDLWERTNLSRTPVMKAGTRLWLGRVYREQKDFDKARSTLFRALNSNNIAKHDVNPNGMHPRSVRIRIEIARVHIDEGDTLTGLDLLREELARCEGWSKIGPDHALTQQIRELLRSIN